jgi:hypothetical protein
VKSNCWTKEDTYVIGMVEFNENVSNTAIINYFKQFNMTDLITKKMANSHPIHPNEEQLPLTLFLEKAH